MSEAPHPKPVTQTISGACLPGTQPSRLERWKGAIMVATAVLAVLLVGLMITLGRRNDTAQEAAFTPPEMNQADQSAAAATALEKAGSDARAAVQARAEAESAESVPERRRAQVAANEIVKRSE